MAVSGQRTTENVAAVQRAIAIDKEILLLEPDAAPLTVLTKRFDEGGNVRSVGDFEFSWVEDEGEVRFDAVNKGPGYTSGETAIETDTGGVFYAAALVRVPRTGEIMYVEKVETNKITVKRGFAGTTAAALEDNDPLFVIGAVAEEGDTSFAARSANPTKVTNYTQIWRTSIDESESMLSSDNQTTPHDWVFQHKKKMIEHLKDLEHAALFGSKGKTTGTNGRRVSTSGGALSFLTANNQDMGGTMTEAELESWVRSITRYGSKTKTVLAARLPLSVINAFATGKLSTIQADKDTTYGLAIKQYVSPHGTINLISHPLLEGAVWGGYMIALDMGQAAPGFHPLGGSNAPHGSRDTKVLTNRQAPDADKQLDEILTEGGFSFKQPKTGGVATGITG
jgi:hypothetical protein